MYWRGFGLESRVWYASRGLFLSSIPAIANPTDDPRSSPIVRRCQLLGQGGLPPRGSIASRVSACGPSSYPKPSVHIHGKLNGRGLVVDREETTEHSNKARTDSALNSPAL